MIIITLIIVWVIDLTDFVDNVKRGIWRLVMGKGKTYKEFSMKPFDCSLCATWWALIIYLGVTKMLHLDTIGICGGLSFLTPVLKNILQLSKDVLNKAIMKVYDLLNL